MFGSDFVKAVTEILDTLAIWQKISMPYELSGKTKFSVAPCIIRKCNGIQLFLSSTTAVAGEPDMCQFHLPQI